MAETKCSDAGPEPAQVALAIATWFPHGGLQRDCLHIAQALEEHGVNVEILAGRATGPEPAGVKLIVTGATGTSNHARDRDFADRLQRRIANCRYDLVVGFDALPGLDVFFAGQVPYCHRKRQAGAIERNLPRYRTRSALESAVGAASSRTHILALTPDIADAFRRHHGTPENRITLIGPTVAEDFRTARNRPADRASLVDELALDARSRLVIFVGSQFKTKGLDRALRAHAALGPAPSSRADLIVVGAGKPDAIRRLARKLGTQDTVHLLGGRDDIARIMSGGDVLLHPAREEATGGVLIEAMAVGLPILCTATCGYASFVADADAGRVLDEPFEQAALDRMLGEMLQTPDSALWSRNGRSFVRNQVRPGWRADAVDFIAGLARERAADRHDPQPC